MIPVAPHVSIVMPAYHATHTIVYSVKSVLQQSYIHWELIIVADDLNDYREILLRNGISDPRIRFLATGKIGSGSPVARNLGLDNSAYRFSAILDADDFMHSQKLEFAIKKVQETPIVSCALQIVAQDLKLFRTVGAGSDLMLNSSNYKLTNFSGDVRHLGNL